MTDYSNELYNSLVETSLRVLVVLQAFRRRLSVDEIRVLEIFAVYGEDVGHDKSLQHRTSSRFHAYGFRKAWFMDALEYLKVAAIVEGDNAQGYTLVISDLFHEDSFVGSLGGEYIDEITTVCNLMAEQAERSGFDEYLSRLTSLAEAGMKAELDSPPSAIETDWLVRNLQRDFWRMEGLRWMAEALSEHVARLPKGLHPRLDQDWLKGLAEAARLEMTRVLREEDSLRRFRESLGFQNPAE